MKEKKLWHLLRGLSASEFRKLGDYLQGDFHEKNKKPVERYYQAIKKGYPRFPEEKWEKQDLFKKIYPKEHYVKGSFRNLTSKFTRIVENFYILLTFDKQNEKKRNSQLIQVFEQRESYDHFKTSAESGLSHLEKQPIRDSDYFYHKYIINQALYANLKTEDHTKKGNYLRAAYDDLNYFFALERLRLGADLENRKYLFSEDSNFQLEHPTFLKPKDNKTLELYEKLIPLSLQGKDDDFFELKSLLETDIEVFNPSDHLDGLLLLINYGFKKINAGKNKFAEPSFDLYKLVLENPTFLSYNYISGITFINILSISTGLEKFDWVEKFLKKYTPLLKKELRPEYTKLGNAFLDFHKKNYPAVEALENNTRLSNVLVTLNIKILVLRATFELYLSDEKNFEEVSTAINSFTKYVSRKDIIGENKALVFKNFGSFYKKLFESTVKISVTAKDFQKLEKELSNYDVIMVRDWFKEKIKNLKG